ncbi:zf-TFIIB domain-containing protein [Pseudooceanicola sp.]|uniref:TFIIB-type zinc ribbon-containing protein n=1 Tax=Pseudooceanicola sp. TaxID=1914328 RepID=UPI00351181B2
MKCPIDGTQLMMTDRSGVEIDYCPQCRGVWLDRGELDKIIERSAAQPAPQRGFDDRRSYDERRGYEDKSYKRKKRGSFLDDLFDF